MDDALEKFRMLAEHGARLIAEARAGYHEPVRFGITSDLMTALDNPSILLGVPVEPIRGKGKFRLDTRPRHSWIGASAQTL